MYVYGLLDFTVGAVGYLNSRYGWGTGPVYLDDVRCRGSEKSILDCSTGNRLYFGDVNPACKNHATDASVYCPTGKKKVLESQTSTPIIHYNYFKL